MFDLKSLLSEHVYAAIAIGGVVEGETVVVLAGLAAHHGYASWWGVTLFAALVNALVDQFWFLVGRWRGQALLARLPGLARRVERLTPRLYTHRRWLVFGLRFSYGLRVAGPLALGMTRIPLAEFALLNLPAALLWSAIFSGLGYLGGMAVIAFLERAHRYEPAIVAGVLVVGGVAWLAARRWARPRQPPTATPNSRPAP
jgi:membrane protein DedA with SNARE-associated domain